MGVKNKKSRQFQHIPLLESAYRKSPQKKGLLALAKQLDMSERQVQRWWRLRRNADKPSNETKFCEHTWKATYFGANSIIGLYIMWNKDYFWDIEKCLKGYPHQGLTNDIWWLYMVNIAYILSSTITVFFDVRRKDFKLMVVHHTVTTMLLTISWISSFYRIGAVLIPLQDGSESMLEVAKAFKIAKYDRLCQVIFYFFTFTWFYTRIYIFPFQILHSTLVKGLLMLSPFFIGFVLNFLLCIIMALQLYWSLLILQVVHNFVVHGIERDVRSSSSAVSDTSLLDGCVKKDDSSGLQ